MKLLPQKAAYKRCNLMFCTPNEPKFCRLAQYANVDEGCNQNKPNCGERGKKLIVDDFACLDVWHNKIVQRIAPEGF